MAVSAVVPGAAAGLATYNAAMISDMKHGDDPVTEDSPRGHEVRVGVISDTHGLLRPEALAALRGSDFIVHAGDIGDPAILQQLAAVAPVTAVRGNNDREAVFDAVPELAELCIGETRIRVIHNLAELPAAACVGAQVIVHGHTHRPRQQVRDGLLYLNPGSAGPRRFALPVGVAHLFVGPAGCRAALVELEIGGA